MKFIFTFLIFFMLCLSLRAQEANKTDDAADNLVTLSLNQSEAAGEAHYVMPVVFKKQKDDNQIRASLLVKEYRKTETIECLDDDLCSGDTNS